MTITPDALTDLTSVRAFLRHAGTAQDANLTALIGAASAAIARWCRRDFFLAANSANPMTSYLSGGGYARLLLPQRPVQAPILTGNTVDGSAAVTGLASTTYLFPGQCVSGPGLQARTFVLAVVSATQVTLNLPATATQTGATLLFGLGVWLDGAAYWGAASGAFSAATQLFEGVDFSLRRDGPGGSSSEVAWLEGINSGWGGRFVRDAGMLAGHPESGQGNLRVKATYGYAALPADLQMAATRFVATLHHGGVRTGLPPGQEDLSAQAAAALTSGEGPDLTSVLALLAPYRSYVVGGPS